MDFKPRTLRQLADMVCGNDPTTYPAGSTLRTFPFVYRSSTFLTEFFADCDTDYEHDGSTRGAWVADTLQQILAEPHSNAQTPPASFSRVIRRLMALDDGQNDDAQRNGALKMLNAALAREGFEAFHAEDKQCYLRHLSTNTIVLDQPNPHRPFSAAEALRREQLAAYLVKASEDDLIEEVLLPLFRQLGFHRVTAAGHKDKALEVRQGRVDEVHAAHAACALFRSSGEEGQARCCWHDQGRASQRR